MSSYATEGRALERARPLPFRARNALRRAALTGLGASRANGRRRARRALPLRLRRRARALRAHSSSSSARVPARAAVRGRRPPAHRPHDGDEVVVTFDDGFRNQLDNAAPILAEQGFSACFFLVTGFVEHAGRRGAALLPRALPPPAAGRADRLGGAERLLELGHEVGSHTSRTRPDVARRHGCRTSSCRRGGLCRRLGNVDHFSAPYGERSRFSDAIADAAAGRLRAARRRSAAEHVGARRLRAAPTPPERALAVRDLAYFLA